jgi:heat shock protein 4
MLEEEEVEVPVTATSEVPKDATKMDTDDVTDDNMQESKGPTAEGATGDEAQDSEEKSVPMDTDAKVCFVAQLLTNF